jgi:hypothetical protein
LKREGRCGDRALCHQREQLVDDLVLGKDIPLGDSLSRAFAKHGHRFIILDRLLRGRKRSEPQPRVHTAFDQAMILAFLVE